MFNLGYSLRHKHHLSCPAVLWQYCEYLYDDGHKFRTEMMMVTSSGPNLLFRNFCKRYP